MRYRSILVHVETDADAAPRIKLAADLAKRFDAHLIGIAACGVHPQLQSIDGAVVGGEVMADEQDRNVKRLKALGELFADLAGPVVPFSWRSFNMAPTEAIAENARAADVIVAGTPEGADTDDALRSVDVGELILSAGKPVLLAGEGLEHVRAKDILVAWKDTREARRAVGCALPLLTSADRVQVIETGNSDSKYAETGVKDVAEFLSRHGVNVEARVVDRSGPTGRQLAWIADEMGADLVVSGGYGHSRLREWVFGGVTRHLLQETARNRLMSA